MKFNRILLVCIVCLEAQTQACPKITFQTSTTGANTAQGSQTTNMTTGIKSIKCSDGPTSTSALLSFTYNDGRGAGPQEGASTTDSCQKLTTSQGNDDGVNNIYYQKTWYWIQAPAGKQVQLIFQKAEASPGVSYSRGYGCTDQGIEIKLKSGQFNRTGTLFCGDDPTIISTSSNIIPFTADSNLAILQVYARKNKFNLQVMYRYMDSTTSSTIPASCQPCIDKYGNCAQLASSCTDPSISTGCPVTCGTCPT